jgi:hypothetical protein
LAYPCNLTFVGLSSRKVLTDPHLWFASRIGPLGRQTVTTSEVYVGGVIDPTLTAWFATRLKETGLLT